MRSRPAPAALGAAVLIALFGVGMAAVPAGAADQCNASSTFNVPAGTRNLTIQDDLTDCPTPGTEIIDPVGSTFTPRVIYNRSTITIYGNNSAETFIVNNPSGSPSLINLVINGGNGNDTFNVYSTASGVTTLVNGKAGSDTVLVGSAGNVQGVAGPLSLNNTGGKIAVTIDDSSDPVGRAATVTAGSIASLAGAAISLSSLSSLVLNEGTGSNSFTIAGTPPGVPVTLNTGTGTNTAMVQAVASGSSLAIQGQSPVDTVTVSGSNGVQGVLGPVSASNSGGTTNLTVDDSGDTGVRTFSVSDTQVVGLAPAAVSFANLGSLTVQGDNAGVTATVSATPPGIPTVLRSGGGADVVNVLATASGSTLTVNGQAGVDTVNLGNAGVLDQLLGAISVNNPLGSTNLVVDGSAATADATITVNPTQVAGAAPAAIAYANVPLLTVKSGAGSDTFLVTPSSSTHYVLDAGAPDPPVSPADTLRVNTAGTTNPTLSSTLTATGYQGTWTFGNRQPVDFSRFESLVPNNSTTTITSSSNTVAAGQPVTFLATVSGSAGSPTGSVAFNDGTVRLATVNLSGGAATYTTSSLSVGSHNMTAAYSGDSNFMPSTSPPLSQVVQGVTAGRYAPVRPYRVLDTRSGTPLGPDSSIDLAIAGTGGAAGVPGSGAAAASLNVTITDATRSSYVTVYPSGSTGRPNASNVNFSPGQTVANLTEVALGPNGHVGIYNSEGTVDVIVDVQGWFSANPTSGPDGLFRALAAPTRILDTRGSLGGHPGPLGPDSELRLQVTGAAPLPPNSGAAAAVLNVTAVAPSASSYLTVYPSGSGPRPLASNLDFPAGRNLPNRVMAQLSAAGQVNIYNSEGSVDVVVDLVGWFTDGSDPAAGGAAFHPLAPARILDTRPGTQVGPYGTAFGPGAARPVGVAGFGGVAANAVALAANVTATNVTAGTFITAYPSASSLPNSSDLNLGPGDTLPNHVVVRLGADGKIQVYNDSGSVDVLVDVAGYYS